MGKRNGGKWINMTQNKRSFADYKMREKARQRDRDKNNIKSCRNRGE